MNVMIDTGCILSLIESSVQRTMNSIVKRDVTMLIIWKLIRFVCDDYKNEVNK